MANKKGMALSGKVAVVTGAGRGMGAAIAEAFAAAGANLVVADLSSQRAQESAHRLARFGRRMVAVKTDVGGPLDVSQLFDLVRSEFGGLGILVTTREFGFASHFSKSQNPSGIDC